MYEYFKNYYHACNESGVPDPLHETLHLVDVMTGGSFRSMLTLADMHDTRSVATKRKNGVPLEHILGRAVFMERAFWCTSDTLIPTPETRLLVETASALLRERSASESEEQTVIEVGTGCGNIAVSLALISTNARVLASDISAPAVEIARKNVEQYGLLNRVTLACGDLFAPFGEYEGAVDMVICNPPYIPTTSLRKLAPEIIEHEPVVALDGGPYGINMFRRLIQESVPLLKHDAALVFEIGEGQEKLVQRLLEKNGCYADMQFHQHQEKIRVVSARKK